MRKDICCICRTCLPWLKRDRPGKKLHPKLKAIPVGGPFERVAVNVLSLPRTRKGNHYIVVFVDYLTKWPKAFATPDHTATTIAELLIEHVVCCHGVPEMLFDCVADFLSGAITEI